MDNRGEARMSKSLYLVCGAGETGVAVTTGILKQGYSAVVIDIDEEKLERITTPEEDVSTVRGDVLDDDVLISAGIADAQGLFATLSEDRENALLCLSARRMNPDLHIVARVKSQETEPKLRLVGVNAVVNQSRVEGFRISSVMLRPDVVSLTDQMFFNPDCVHAYQSIPVPEGSSVSNRRIDSLDITGKTGVVLIAIRRSSGKMVYNPGPREKIREGDSLISFATEEEVEAITALLK